MKEIPPAESSAHMRTLQRAAETLGGVRELAELLGKPVADVQRWVDGKAQPPQDLFLVALDIVAGGRYAERPRRERAKER
jgi:hypothetical protein